MPDFDPKAFLAEVAPGAECTCTNTGRLEPHDEDCPVPTGGHLPFLVDA